ncbi:MAG TPA: hypothetical protein VGG29_07940 [Caulobacteraceae bacterium]|jgi:hypothetical protein
MRSFALAAAAAALSFASASAAPQPQPPPNPAPRPGPALPTPPRAFAMAGYTEPAIPAAACRVVDAGRAQCVIPAMTAGRYLADIAATSTATAADAAQEIVVVAGDQSCRLGFAPSAQHPWAVGAKHTLHVGCVFAVLSDMPLPVTVVYIDRGATKEAGGPALSLQPQPWGGALNAVPISFPDTAPTK